MKNYVLIYFNPGVRDNVAPADFQAEWGTWFGSLGDKLVDAGNPFGDSGQTVNKSGATAIAQLPATGYSIVKAETMDEAVAMAQACPVLNEPAGAVQVYETLPM